MNISTVLVVGATGHVGRQVVPLLLKRGVSVWALVRPGSDASALEAQGVNIVRGDMMDPNSLDIAFSKKDAIISCAAGYTRRRKSDSSDIDRIGNANLALAAKKAGTKRYILNSILKCDDAPEVSHFADKAFAESKLRILGVPFVAIRPGAFLDQSKDFLAQNIQKNFYLGLGDTDKTRWSWVYTPDLAHVLVQALFADSSIIGKIIEVGWANEPVTNRELADAIAQVTARKLKRVTIPWWIMRLITAIVSPFNQGFGDLGRMFLYFKKGHYVADAVLHEAFFGSPPTMEDALKRWALSNQLILGSKT